MKNVNDALKRQVAICVCVIVVIVIVGGLSKSIWSKSRELGAADERAALRAGWPLCLVTWDGDAKAFCDAVDSALLGRGAVVSNGIVVVKVASSGDVETFPPSVVQALDNVVRKRVRLQFVTSELNSSVAIVHWVSPWESTGAVSDSNFYVNNILCGSGENGLQAAIETARKLRPKFVYFVGTRHRLALSGDPFDGTPFDGEAVCRKIGNGVRQLLPFYPSRWFLMQLEADGG